ncbi:MAG: hypothetical protein WC617_12165 [Rhodanobacter sp.]|jgi:hypothetical protein
MNARIIGLTLTVATALLPCTSHAEDTASRLISVLSCESNASPAKVSGLIRALGGHSLMSESAFTDVEYTLPNPISVFGQPITAISVHPGSNADGDFTEYRSLFSAPAATVARYAGITLDQGAYKRQAGNNDVALRFEPAGSYIVCAQGVRSIPKWIRREYRGIEARF